MEKSKIMKKDKKIIFYKDTCITCKKSISEIQRMKIDIQKRDFFKDPFTELELKKIIKITGMSPREMIRKRDKMFKELQLETKNFSDDQIIKMMVMHPGLIARPIIISDNKAFVGKTATKNL